MSIKYKCVLLDDELPGLTYLKMLCEQIEDIEVVKVYNNPLLFLKESSHLQFDFCISDIEMVGVNGLELAKLLKDKPLIFATAYKEYAVEAFEFSVVDYMVKPITKLRLEQAIDKMIHRLSAHTLPKNFIKLNTNKGKISLNIDQLIYIKTSTIDSRDKEVLLSNATSLVLKNISFPELLKILPAQQFCRINKKEIIAINTVQFYTDDSITIALPQQNILQLNLGDLYRQDFLKVMNV